MIIFTDNVKLLESIKDKFKSDMKVYNFTSMYSGYNDMTVNLATNVRFIPRPENMKVNEFVDTVDFDVAYARYILEDEKMFESLMNIMIPSKNGWTVVVLVYREPYRDSLMESIIKLIQQRYGYNAWIVNDIEDLDTVKESDYTDRGLAVLEKDIKRFDLLFVDGKVAQPLPNINREDQMVRV